MRTLLKVEVHQVRVVLRALALLRLAEDASTQADRQGHPAQLTGDSEAQVAAEEIKRNRAMINRQFGRKAARRKFSHRKSDFTQKRYPA